MEEIVVSILFALFLAGWRRLFGSDVGGILGNRAFQHIIAGVCVGLYLIFFKNESAISTIVAVILLQAWFWGKGHGELFDMGHSVKPDVSRYNRYWYTSFVKRFLAREHWYSYTFDWLMMIIRYSIPAIVISLILCGSSFCLAGFAVACSYAICWNLYDCDALKSPTEKAELLAGFCVGLLL